MPDKSSFQIINHVYFAAKFASTLLEQPKETRLIKSFYSPWAKISIKRERLQYHSSKYETNGESQLFCWGHGQVKKE